MQAELDALYTNTTEPFKSQLRQFRQTHIPNVVYSNGVKWTYLTGGKGDEVVLVLHGGGGPAESLFRYILALEDSYRVIAPTIPSGVTNVADALGSILAIFDEEAVTAVHIFGVSNGGMIGQCLLRQCPHRVLTLVLFHSMLPSVEYARLFGKRAKLLSLIPRWVIVTMGQRWLNKQIQVEAPNAMPGEQSFWTAYFKELYNSELVTKTYFVSRAKILTDYFLNYRFDPHELDNWSGKIFIIESQNDQVVNERERERLKRFYSQAKVHTFQGAGHLGGGLFKVEETFDLIKAFFMSYAGDKSHV
jgi:pimeloyl-ACP methyl ester carboxylesterase